MRKENLILAIVCIVSVMGAHLLATNLDYRTTQISRGRNSLNEVPMAGFQKFAADIQWMLFLQFAGANPITQSNADKYDHRIRQIIRLDPNFFRIYYEGALMLQPVNQKKALEILDLGINNAEIGGNWKLPMLAGQIIMRKQWDAYYQDQPMNREEVERAFDYYKIALNSRGRQGTALNSYIRVEAALKVNDKPRIYNELESWFTFWKDKRFNGDNLSLGGSWGGADRGMAGDIDSGPPFDMNEKIISLIRKAREMYPDNEDVNALIEEIRVAMFPSVRFNPITMEPINTDALMMKSDSWNHPESMTYDVDPKALHGYSILSFAVRSRGGTGTATLLIDGKPVTGVEAVPLTTALTTFSTTGENVVQPGQNVELRVSDLQGAGELSYAMEYYFSSGGASN